MANEAESTFLRSKKEKKQKKEKLISHKKLGRGLSNEQPKFRYHPPYGGNYLCTKRYSASWLS